MNRILGPPMRGGYTLLELTIVIVVMMVAISSTLPGLQGLRDRLAVLQAREALVGSVAWARRSAQGHQGAWVRVVPDSALLRWGLENEFQGFRDLGRELGVSLEGTSGGAFTLRFDDLGLGQVASRTIVFRRGSAEAGVSLSSYGRVRRW